jgi:peptidoglycan/xylan/chitin deacetylase (PgdA/CDA1 family)
MVTSQTSRHSTSGAKKVWLTFDDGPHPEYTSAILDILSELNIRATFFVLGSSVRRMGTAVLERIRSDGHCIGSHGYSHRNLSTLSEDEVREEITSTESLITDLLSASRVFRPPYGASSPIVDRVLIELGYRKVLWNVDTRDWDPVFQPNGWVELAVSQISERKRALVLAHDTCRTTADHLADLVDRIGKAKFEPYARSKRPTEQVRYVSQCQGQV